MSLIAPLSKDRTGEVSLHYLQISPTCCSQKLLAEQVNL